MINLLIDNFKLEYKPSRYRPNLFQGFLWLILGVIGLFNDTNTFLD